MSLSSVEPPNSWRAVWSKKAPAGEAGDPLAALIQADGFDSGFSSYTPEEWRRMVADAAERTGVSRESRVLEVGCGAGAFLYALSELTGCAVSGIDYSPSLLAAARAHLPQGQFLCAEANSIPFPAGGFDQVFSHGVFFYFPDHTYVREALREAHTRLRRGGHLCLMDLNDRRREGEYMALRRSQFSTPEEYDAKYAGLPHLFFDRHELADTLASLGFGPVQFFEHRIARYEAAGYRFNLTARKE